MGLRSAGIIGSLACISLVLPVAVVHADPVAPRAYWPFNASGATFAPDASGNGFNAFASATAPVYSTDVPTIPGIGSNPRSLSFTRTSSQGLFAGRSVQDDITLCSWFKTTSVGAALAHYQLMVIFESELGGAANDFGFGVDSAGKLAFGVGPSDTTIRTASSVNTGDWTHGCATRRKSDGAMSLFINGLYAASGTGSAGNSLSAAPNMFMGRGTDGGVYWNGNMDDMRAYDTVLPAADIYFLYSGAYPASSSSSADAGGGGGGGPPVWLIQLRQQNGLNLLGQPASSSSSSASSAPASAAPEDAGAQAVAASSSAAASLPPPLARPAVVSAQSPLQLRTCGRVARWFVGGASARGRLNARLFKAFGFTCKSV